MTTITLHEGDNRDHLRRLIDEGVRVQSVVTDPPYGLVSVTKRFGGKKAAPAKFGTDGAFQRQSKGFMGSIWDGTGIERDPEFWTLIHNILLPGGYVLAFSSPRTGHWQAVAMESAGFVMHPFQVWAYGSGFPKAHNAAMAIDKALGIKGSRGAPKSAAHAGWIDRGRMRGEEGEEGWQRPWMDDAEKVATAASKYVPGSPEAARWEGWAYGAQSLKPAIEPIYMAQKPFSEKTGAANILKHGVGAVNIDGCRVPVQGETTGWGGKGASGATFNAASSGLGKNGSPRPALGRHPANLLHDGSDAVRAMFPDSKGQLGAVGPRSGPRKSKHCYGDYPPPLDAQPRGDSGSAARFFNAFPTDSDSCMIGTEREHELAVPLIYLPKANKADRAGSKHPTVKPVALMQHLVRLVTPPGGTVLDPFAGSGTTAEAARREGLDCILMEGEAEYAADIRRRFALADDFEDEFSALIDGAEDFAALVG